MRRYISSYPVFFTVLVYFGLIGCSNVMNILGNTTPPSTTPAPRPIPTAVALATVVANPSIYAEQVIVVEGVIDSGVVLPACEIYIGPRTLRTLYTRSPNGTTSEPAIPINGVHSDVIPIPDASTAPVQRIVGIVRYYNAPAYDCSFTDTMGIRFLPPARQFWYIELIGILPM